VQLHICWRRLRDTSHLVIPVRAQREPGIHLNTCSEARWIPGSMLRIALE
jgi:hypothetical protein